MRYLLFFFIVSKNILYIESLFVLVFILNEVYYFGLECYKINNLIEWM